MTPMEISRTGLEVEWRRLEVIAENIANMNTTRTALGEAYRPMRLVSGPAGTSFAAALVQADGRGPAGTAVYGLEPMQVPPRLVHEPGHPHADENGYVTYPGIDHAAEMTLMVRTARTYEANLVALNIARNMYSRALELGK